ncbi:MAG: hypothetical protein RBS39_08850 [Phycisphaerales bacterium]|nr:hypothetical protein [Phycisphaerales bacterium]
MQIFIGAIAAIGAMLPAIPQSRRWLRAIDKDLELGIVEENHLQFTTAETPRSGEPLMLRMESGYVLTIFDLQWLGGNEQPRQSAAVAWIPSTRWLISVRFLGESEMEVTKRGDIPTLRLKRPWTGFHLLTSEQFRRALGAHKA